MGASDDQNKANQPTEAGCSGNACKFIATSAEGWSNGNTPNGTIVNTHPSQTIIVDWDYGSVFGKAGSMKFQVLPGSSKKATSPASTGFMDTYKANFK